MTATSFTPRTVRSNWKPRPSVNRLPAALGLIRQRIETLGDIGAAATALGGSPKILALSTPRIAACSTTWRL